MLLSVERGNALSKQYDVFLSHVGAEKDSARRIKHTLEKKGLTVWFDEDEIDDFASIVKNIQIGLASSKSLLALYSKNYPLRRACQWELTAAYVAAQRKGQVKTRILIVNPEESVTHIYNSLREFLFRKAPVIGNEQEYEEFADSIKNHLSTIEGYLGELLPLIQPRWYGMAGVGSNRFVGRLKEMWNIHAALHASDTVLVAGSSTVGSTHASSTDVVHIRGLAGNGKSLLAEEYALRFGIAYPGGIFWLNAFGNHSIRSKIDTVERNAAFGAQMEVIAKHLGIRTEDYGGDLDYIRGAIGSKVEELGKPCLWIVDDIPSGLSAQELRRFYSPHPLAKTLITTRSHEYDTSGVQLYIAELSKEDAYQLVTRGKLLPKNEETAAGQIIELLGCHALAVDIAGMISRHLGIEGLLKRLTDFKDNDDAMELAGLLREQLPNGYEKSIAKIFLSSINELDENGKIFLRIASVIAVAPIPTSLIQGVFQRLYNFDESTAEQNTALAIDQVLSLSLVEDKGRKTWEVHTLISRTMRFYDKESQTKTEILKRTIKEILLDKLSLCVGDIRQHDMIENEVVHARKLITDVTTLDDIQIARCLVRYYIERGSYKLAQKYCLLDLKKSIETFGTQHESSLLSMNEYANILFLQGYMKKARKVCRKVLNLRVKELGKFHPDTLTTLNSYANILRGQGDLKKARTIFKKVLAARKELLGEDHLNTLVSINNLAVAFSELGDLEKARSLQEKSLEIRKRVLGEDHPDTLSSMSNLAQTLCELGNFEDSRNLQLSALEKFKSLLGVDHPETIKQYGNLGAMLWEAGDLANAKIIQEDVLDKCKKILGYNHPLTLDTINSLAVTKGDLGDFPEARSLQEEVVEISTKILGMEHPTTIFAIGNLATTLVELGDLVGAHEYNEKAVKLSRRILGKNHHRTLILMNNLSGIQEKLGDVEGACKSYEKTLRISRRIYGEEHPITITTMSNLASILVKRGKLRDANSVFDEVLNLSNRVWGEDHPNTLKCMNNLAVTLNQSGDSEVALSLYEKVLKISMNKLGERHPSTIMSMNNIGVTMKKLNDLQSSRKFHQRALEISKDVFGIRHHLASLSAYNLIVTLGELKDFNEILEILVSNFSWLAVDEIPNLSHEQRIIQKLLSEYNIKFKK